MEPPVRTGPLFELEEAGYLRNTPPLMEKKAIARNQTHEQQGRLIGGTLRIPAENQQQGFEPVMQWCLAQKLQIAQWEIATFVGLMGCYGLLAETGAAGHIIKVEYVSENFNDVDSFLMHQFQPRPSTD